LATGKEAPVSVEENMALVRRFFEARGKGDLNAIEELLAPDFVVHTKLFPDQQSNQSDRDGYLRATAEYSAAFSNVRILVEDQVAGGDKVVTRFIVRGTHDREEILGVAPTGRETAHMTIVIHRISGGKIAEEWGVGTSISELREGWVARLQRLEQDRIERERVQQELLVARRIQLASLPKEVPTLEGWQISPLYQPAREVGGDFYDFYELDDGRVGLVVGDATGKGVPAALVENAICAFLGGVAIASGSRPGEVLARVNEKVLARIPPNMFVTCFYCILEPESGHLIYANAGHDLPYLRRSGDAEELRARGMPLGLMSGMSYEEGEVSLGVGDSILFYTDGLVEAHDPKGEMFGFPRLRALLAEHVAEESSLGDFLLEKLYSFVGEGWEQEDDITLLMLKRSASLS
jgi:serine phosphatase RsbU (regulator of sigma subunit)/predicted ester cyclase